MSKIFNGYKGWRFMNNIGRWDASWRTTNGGSDERFLEAITAKDLRPMFVPLGHAKL